VGFCRLAVRNSALLRMCPLLTTVLSIKLAVPQGNNHRWHAVCSLTLNLQDWLPGVAGTDPRLGYRFWGVNCERGGLHQPPFSFPGALLALESVNLPECPESYRLNVSVKASRKRKYAPASAPLTSNCHNELRALKK
jgi:hypothetical protein